MFCYQCEQTSKGVGCQTRGVCGKDETIAALHDLLTHAVKGIAVYAHHARLLGVADKRLRVCDPEVDAFVIEALFATLTNVNFDKDRLVALIYEAVAMRAAARCVYERAAGESGIAATQFGGAAVWIPADTEEGLIAQGLTVSLPARILYEGKEIANLQELVLYGIKGVAAYAAHALALGAGEAESFGKIHEVLCFLTREKPSVAELLAMALSVGELNYRVLEVLDKAHTETFGNPRPTRVRLGARKGKAILVSGHDLHDPGMRCWSRRGGRGSRCIRMARCCRRMGIRSCGRLRTWRGTMAARGWTRRRISRRFRGDPDDVELHAAAEGDV